MGASGISVPAGKGQGRVFFESRFDETLLETFGPTAYLYVSVDFGAETGITEIAWIRYIEG